jgi:hypothetical protein
MMETTSISISYSEGDDRLFLDATGVQGAGRLILTRRITRRLLSAFVKLLEKSSVALTRAPADMRTEVIALEHLSAMQQPQEARGPAQSGSALPKAFDPMVVAKVDVQTLPRAFRLVFHSAQEPVASLTLNRQKFHRLLAALDRFATAAEWNIRDGAEWLDATTANAGGGRMVS